MSTSRRVLGLLVVLTALAVPPIIFRALCLGHSCAGTGGGEVRVPFCPLPARLRSEVSAGFRDGRSPDVLAVDGAVPVVGGVGVGEQPSIAAPWPSTSGRPDTRVPIAFAGAGVNRDGMVPDGTGLDQIAPTVADVLRLVRPHPEVRAGKAIAGVGAPRAAVPRLVLEVAWKGVGSEDLERSADAWPFLRSLVRGAGTLEGDTGSLPLDPAATLTTIGTGGLPFQHGITGTAIRSESGAVVQAWGPNAPTSIIATLPDDLDQALRERPLVGLIGADPTDRGLIGTGWYVPHDRDRVVLAPQSGAQVHAVARMLGGGFGVDDVPDILGVVMQGPIPQLDAELRSVVKATETETGGATMVVIAGTGSATPPPGPVVTAPRVAQRVNEAVGGDRPVVAAAAPGGLFLDQATLAREGISGQAVQQALLDLQAPGGKPLFEDAFQGFAIAFARYC